MNKNRNVHTFLACDNEYDESKIVIFGAPFDSTTSFRPGTRFASSAIRNESFGIEVYSPYQDKDLEDIKVFDGGDLELAFGEPSGALDQIEETAATILADGKLPIMIGGEHLVTLGAVRAAFKKHPDLRIIHFDAHADLREDYLGVSLSHASVIRRCYDMVGDKRIFQFGIRSGLREEFQFGTEHLYMQKFNFTGIEKIKDIIKDAPVYLTIDLDVLDPSQFPGTGTPEAGGVTFLELIAAIDAVKELNIVAADVNELSPMYDQSGASTALACKVMRELMLSLYK